MIDKLKVMNFLQDFGCARLDQLQTLFEDKDNNFKSVLDGNMVSKKGNIFVHNTRAIDENMIIALDVLCRFKKRCKNYYVGSRPIKITFIANSNMKYHIIVADEDSKEGIVKIVNDYPVSLPKADKLILAFPDRVELSDIECLIPFAYLVYPEMKVIN